MPFYDPETNQKIVGIFPYNLARDNQSISSLHFNRPQVEIKERPTFDETFAASLGEYSGFVNLPDFIRNQLRKITPRERGFNPYEGLEGTPYARFTDEFAYANNEQDKELIKARIDYHLQNQEVLMQSGLLGVGTSMVAGLLGPGSLIPVGGTLNALIKGGSLLKNAARGAFVLSSMSAGGELVDQAILQMGTDVRTWGESIQDITGATVLGGLLGAGIGMSTARSLNLSNKLEEIFKLPPVNERMHGDTITAPSWQEAQVKLKREGLISKLPKLGPGTRTLSSELSSSRKASANLAETGIIIEGEKLNPAVETVIRSRMGQIGKRMENVFLDEFRNYVDRIGARGPVQSFNTFFRQGGRFDEFSEQLAFALRRGDASDIPEIEKAAAAWRREMDAITQEALDLDLYGIKARKVTFAQEKLTKVEKEVAKLEKQLEKLQDKTQAKTKRGRKAAGTRVKRAKNKLEEARIRLGDSMKNLEDAQNFKPTLSDLNVGKTAKSYFPRLYNKQKIKNNPDQFESTIADHFQNAYGLDDAQARRLSKEVYNKIIGTPEGRVLAYDPFITERGPLKGRTLNIPDTVLEPFLINDSPLVFDRFLRTVMTDIELTKRFGDVNATDAIKAIKTEADILEDLNPSQKGKIRRVRDSDIKDIQGMINRLRGLEGLAYEDGAAYSVLRTLRNWNNSRLMGSLGLNVFTDIGQMVLQNGFFRTFGSMAKLFTMKVSNPKAYKALSEDLEAMAVGIDAFSNSRRSLYEIGTNEPLGNRVEQLSKRLANATFKASMMSNIDGFTKKVSGYAAAERIRRNVIKGASNISTAERRWMRNLGIGDESYASINAQIKRFSRKEDAFRVFNTLKWTNTEALEQFTAALKKVENISIITPGVGDAPLIFDNPAWQLLFQYKRFALAAMNRSLIPALQRTDAGVFAGLSTMFSGGIMRECIKELLAGRDPKEMDTERLIKNAFLRMDTLAYIPDLWDEASSLIGESPYGENAISRAFGPTSGLIGNTIPNTFQGVKNLLQGEAMTKQQVRAARQLLPFQNLYYINGLLTYTEKAINEELGNF